MSAFGLIDGNDFYVASIRAFDPRLARIPVAVLSNGDGCVIARSAEVKTLGVKMAQPLFEVRGLLEKHRAAILSSNYTLFDDMSRRFQGILYDFTPDVEHYSIDECFVRMPLSVSDLVSEGQQIRQRIRALSGIPVSVGFGPTKTLAKLANRIAKKSDKAGGVVSLYQSPHIDVALERMAVGDVWGVGPRYAAMLEKSGICNALQLRDADDQWVRKRMTVTGLRTVHELRGIQCISFEPTPKTQQQICCSRTFGGATDDLRELRAAVAWFTARAAEKLRTHGLVAGELAVFVTTDRFKDSPQYSNAASLRIAPLSSSTLELLPLAMRGLASIYRSGYPIRKAGVLLDRLEFAERASRRLWDAATQELHRRLMDAIDAINERWGKDSVRCGLYPSTGIWQTRAERCVPCYTTKWTDIMVAT
jgi:DNA polymerase V